MNIFLYTPEKKEKARFLSEFVVRTREFEELFQDLQTSKMKYPEQHYLLVGERGSGKTTLLTRLKYAIEDDPKLQRWLIPISFKEEQYYISELVNLWETIALQLGDRAPYKSLHAGMALHARSVDFEARAFDLLIRALDEAKEKLVLFIDNIGDLLNKLTELEIRRLREILQTQPQIRLIAGSSVSLQDTTDYHQPLYEFFKVIQLNGLNSRETLTLLRTLGKLNGESDTIEQVVRDTPSRIETLRNLSGGTPRMMVLLYRALVSNHDNDPVYDLESILDALTPLYKQRMDNLPAQQQKIVDAVARNWDAISVRELTERTRIESKINSAQLRQLEKNQVIEKRSTNTKNHLYLLRERFMNIWYLMRYGRAEDRQRVVWLVRFLEQWGNLALTEQRMLDFAARSRKGTLGKRAKAVYEAVYASLHPVTVPDPWKDGASADTAVSEPNQPAGGSFELRLQKARERGNWAAYLEAAGRNLRYTDAQRRQAFDILNDDRADAFHEAVLSGLKTYEPRRSNSDIPYFYRAYLFLYNVKEVYKHLAESDENHRQKFIVYTASLYNSLVEKKENGAPEEEAFFQFIFALMVTTHYQTAVALFRDHFRNEETRHRHKLLYYTALYVAGHKKDDTIERLDGTARNYVSNLAQRVEAIQKKLRIP